MNRTHETLHNKARLYDTKFKILYFIISDRQTSYTQSSTMEFQPIVQARYVDLVLTQNLDAFPPIYLKHLPRYNG